MTVGSVFNHVGHCVRDLAVSRRFYEELLGFSFERELAGVDESNTATLLRIAPPVGLTAVYLRRDGLVLELLHYDRPGNPPSRERPMNEPGLTHLSLSVDIDAILPRVPEYGGEVIEDTVISSPAGVFAVMIRDPDGQLIELLPMEYRASLG